MVKKEARATKDLVLLEKQVKAIIHAEPSILHHYYMVFAKEIYSKARKYKAQNLYREIMILEAKWEARGLTPWILEVIKNIWGVPIPFRLDISELDGPHILS